MDRVRGQVGTCGMGSDLRVARASLHLWEEPSLSGEHGSGTVFFSGCPLSCVYCQNHTISSGKAGEELTIEDLVEVFLKLQSLGAENINLVTACHFLPQIKQALVVAKERGLNLPIVYNSSGYESVAALRELAGLIDIYLPDFRYWDDSLALRYSAAPNYVEVAKAALAEMFCQVGPFVLDKRGMMIRGMIVRQLLLPGQTEAAMAISHYLHKRYGDAIMLSLMSQYTPLDPNELSAFPELQQRVNPDEYERWIDFCMNEEIINAYVQEGEAASESFIPDFYAWRLDKFLRQV
ncbi:MAG: radical SAM protein [Eubacteriales bacterium]|nr:radical SAM protein [Eubacteriales bacterium]